MTAAELERYAAAVGELPILGNLVFFTVRERDYDRAKMTTLFTELGLAPELLPKPDTPLNAFRKACKGANEKIRYRYDSGGTAHILVRELASDNESVTRALVREVRDESNKRLSYDQVAVAKFSRPGVGGTTRLRLSIEPGTVSTAERPKVSEALDLIDRDFERFKKYMDSAKVRWMVRDYLRLLQGVPVRASTWFIHDSHSEELGRLRELLVRMGCEMDRVPLLELQETRSMLVKAVVTDTNEELEGVINDIVELRGNRTKITGAAYAKVKSRYSKALELAGQFTHWLGESMDAADATLEMASKQLAQLQKEMLDG